jgi:hypothetical protein
MPRNVPFLASFACLTVCALLALLCFANGLRTWNQDSTVGVVFGLSGLLWVAAFSVAMLRRWAALRQIAVGGIASAGALGSALLLSVPAVELNAALLAMFAVEALVLFSALFGCAIFLQRRLAQ